MTPSTHARLNLFAGVVLLLWIARPVPSIVLYRFGYDEAANWWFHAIAWTLVNNAMISPLVWMFLEVPIGLAFGLGMISKGLRR